LQAHHGNQAKKP